MNILHLSMGALILSFLIVWIMMPYVIPVLQKLKLGQEIRELGPQSHLKKAGTPTMGGVSIITAMIISTALIGFLSGNTDWYAIILVIVYGLIGFLDDYIKVKQRHNEGLTVKQKFALQIIAALFFTFWAYTHSNIGSTMIIPFVGSVDFGIWYIPITFIAIIAITNAVNLTDGLDGLCSGVSAITMIFFLTAGISVLNYSTSIFAGAFIGSCLGFLRYNSNPANVFMGDTGSLALGGGLVGIAIQLHLEIFFIIAGFIFVLEALSVVLQVGYFKLSHGKRIFRMTPIHHHFELGGWKETRVVSVFYTWAAICVAIAYFFY